MSADALTSSPLSSITASQQAAQPSASQPDLQYCPACDIPFELTQHVQTYFEESLYTQALNLLISIVSSSVSGNPSVPIKTPTSEYLAVIATLTVHPTVTTRTYAKEKWAQAIAAKRLLRLLLKTAGPANARFADAFAFRKYAFRSGRRTDARNADNAEEQFSQSLSIPYSDSDGLFALAEDFWAVVGWALNCACLPGIYASRWEWWSLWLELMIDILEADWKLHLQSDDCHNSLIWRYIETSAGGDARGRRILRAIFADGSTSSLNEFREIFRKELKEPKSDEDRLKKREVNVNVEDEIYGDYLVQEESDDSTEDPTDQINIGAGSQSRPSKRLRTRTPSARRLTPRASSGSLYRSGGTGLDNDSGIVTPTDGLSVFMLGSTRSLGIRLRLMILLVQVSSHPTLTNKQNKGLFRIFPDLHDLYTLFVEFMKPLPLPAFQHLMSPSTFPAHIFPSDIKSSLCEFLLQRLLESSAPNMVNLSDRSVTQQILIDNYLPFAAAKANIDAQCRASLVMETLVRQLAAAGDLIKTAELVSALEAGIARRLTRVADGTDTKAAKRKAAAAAATTNGKGEDEIGSTWNWLVESGERMQMVVRRLKDEGESQSKIYVTANPSESGSGEEEFWDADTIEAK